MHQCFKTKSWNKKHKTPEYFIINVLSLQLEVYLMTDHHFICSIRAEPIKCSSMVQYTCTWNVCVVT